MVKPLSYCIVLKARKYLYPNVLATEIVLSILLCLRAATPLANNKQPSWMHGIVLPCRTRDLGSQDLPAALGGFDGHAEFLQPNQDCMKAVVEDTCYKDVMVKDLARFLKREATV